MPLCVAARSDHVTQRVGLRGEDLERLLDLAEHRGRADAEPRGEVGVGLALAQVRQHQQGPAVRP